MRRLIACRASPAEVAPDQDAMYTERIHAPPGAGF